ncbi:MAG: NAD(P)/FAD-dependent oxidoreductase [Bacteroidota bacterium]
MSSKKVIILGAGLCGLAIGYELKKRAVDFKILEARDRVGGRIQTITGELGTPMEMGATWLGRKHYHLVNFLDEIGIETFQQYNHGVSFFETMSFIPPQKFEVPASEEPNYRIKGGTQQMILKLKNTIGKNRIHLNQIVHRIEKTDGNIHVITKNDVSFSGDMVISTLPPKLLVNTVSCSPKLPDLFLSISQTTQTWMENSIKFAVEYKKPFWRQNGQSGMVFSQSSYIPEMYDHCDFEMKKFALKGFLSAAVNTFSRSERETKTIQNLVKFFGEDAGDYESYYEKLWENESFTYSASPVNLFAHQNNGHEVFQKGYWDHQFWLAGTETAPSFGGYMDGAIESALNTTSRVEKFL